MRRSLASALALSVSFLAPHFAQAQMLTKFEKEGPCKTRITVPIEIYGDGANDDFAFEIRKNVRDQWAGPSAEDAAAIGSSLGLETDWLADDGNADWYKKYMEKNEGAIDPEVNQDGTQELVDNAGQIRGIYADYVREFSADAACIQGECCAVRIVTDVKVREADDDPSEGYYQIEIVDDPNFRSYVWAGHKAREGVENPDENNPDDWQTTPGTNGGSNGKWANNSSRNAAAHEVGHLMGLMDQYKDIKNADGDTIGSFQQHGHRHDIMAQSEAFPYRDAIGQLMEIGGIECDEETCCPGFEYNRFGQNYGVTVLAVGDAIAACNKPALRRLRSQLVDQRRNLMLASRIPAHRKIPLAVAIDEKIARIDEALKKVCDRPVTGTTIGEDYTPEPIPVESDTDSTTWCEYGTDSPGGGTLIPYGGTPGTTPGSTPGSTPGTTPGTTPGSTPGTTPGTTPGSTPGTTPGSTPGTTPGGRPTISGGVPIGSTPKDEDDPEETTPEETDDPTDDTPEIPTTVYVKAKASVLKGDNGTKTSEIGGQRIKLIPDATKNPALPTDPGAQKDQTGADDDPAQCTTDDDGECQIVIADTRTTLGLGLSWGVSARYDYEVETPQSSGATVIGDEPLSDADKDTIVDELTGNGLDEDDIEFNNYRLGDKWVTGIGYGLKYDYGDDWSLDLGLKYKIEPDLCRTIQPGPPLGSSPQNYSAIGGEIPGAVISLPGHMTQENAQ